MDSKSGAWYALECGGFRRIVDVGSFSRTEHTGRHFGVEDPQIRGASIKVHAELLTSDGDGRQEFGITLCWLICSDAPGLLLSSCGLHLCSASDWCDRYIRGGRLINSCPPVFPICLIQSRRAVASIGGIPALSLNFKGPAL